MIWDFQDTLSRRLLLWSALSAVAGAALLLTGGDFWRGFGVQALVWGAVDAAIAWFGQRSAARRRARGPHSAEALAREAAKLRRLLWINTGLDVLYVAGGLALLYTLGAQDRFAAGNGWGIIVQGGFLFFFAGFGYRLLPFAFVWTWLAIVFLLPLWLALLYPLSVLLALVIAVRSVVLAARGRSTWKGRTLIRPQIRWW